MKVRDEGERGRRASESGNERQEAVRRVMPELYQVVVECRDEAEQREVFERMREEGRRVRVMVL